MVTKIFFTVMALLSFSVYAEKPLVNLSVENTTSKVIVVKKSDGTKFSLQPGQTLGQVLFERYSDVQSFVGGKLSCTWRKLDDRWEECEYIAGLMYETQGNCRILYRQSIPC